MVCAELAPWAKTGGLADAEAGLSDALAAAGHDVRVLLPRYSHLAAPRKPGHSVRALGRSEAFRFGEVESEQKTERSGSRQRRPRVFLLEMGEFADDVI